MTTPKPAAPREAQMDEILIANGLGTSEQERFAFRLGQAAQAEEILRLKAELERIETEDNGWAGFEAAKALSGREEGGSGDE